MLRARLSLRNGRAMLEASSFAELAVVSREFLVACNRDGEVLYADERAQ